MKKLILGKNESGQRTDKFLRKLLWKASLSQIYKLLRLGKIKVNSKKVKPEYFLKLNDEVKIFLNDEQYQELTSEERKKFKISKINFSILYEDKDLLVVDKPAGLSTHGASGIKSHTLIDEVLHYLNFVKNLTFRPSFINRLDKGTSGALIVGKTFESLKHLNKQMANNEITKCYIALVKGRVKSGIVDEKLLKTRLGHEFKVKLSEEGKESVTKYNLIKNYGDYSLIEAELLTGRTHQIRVHMAAIGHPIVGDDSYGDEKTNDEFKSLGLRRQFLHSHKLIFKHPKNRKDIEIISNLPDDLKKVLDKLVK
ncbi:MAG: RluA family pseudouridine synthase [Candidatus Nanoarchaeia archaeon]|nr:RluA family pseudouridine synthase [Candidatus Nanoarchaeia archaeon]